MVKMVINGFEYNIRKKLVNQQFLDLVQLSDRVRQIESLRMEKEYIRKGVKKERAAFVNYIDSIKTNEEEEDQESFCDCG